MQRLMVKMIRRAYMTVKGAYPAGCLGWLKENDPDKITELRATIEAAKRAYLANDPSALKGALKVYKDEHTKTFARYLDAVVMIEEDR